MDPPTFQVRHGDVTTRVRAGTAGLALEWARLTLGAAAEVRLDDDDVPLVTRATVERLRARLRAAPALRRRITELEDELEQLRAEADRAGF